MSILLLLSAWGTPSPEGQNQSEKRTHTQAFAYMSTVSAAVFHRRMGHLNEDDMGKLRAMPGSGVSYPGALAPCEPCRQSKSHHLPHPQHAQTRATERLGLVHTDSMGPVTPVSLRGFSYLTTFTDGYSRRSDITGHK